MDITTRNAVGDTIYIIQRSEELTPVDCAICTSTGEVTLSGETFKCPSCLGAKNRSGSKVNQVTTVVVEKVLIAKCSQQCQIRYNGLRADGKHVTVAEVDSYATEVEAQAALS